MTIPARGRRAYNRVSAEAEEEQEPSVTTTEEEESLTNQDDKNSIDVIIMDPAQRKFTVKADPDWTIQTLKQHGTKIHKVPAAQQRLVYMGRLLQDQDTLRDAGLTESQTIIHLFPKPRVVVAESSSSVQADDDDESVDLESGGAHVPQIVLDPEEAERRSSILVLGSEEVIEAQNNIKLFSTMLLVVCSLELLTLFTIAVGGVPDDSQSVEPSNTDDSLNPYGEEEPMRTWRNSDYFDLVLSTVGFYVATLGIKASTENTMRLARRYLIGTVVVGLAWTIFYYILNLQAVKEADAKRVAEHDDDLLPPMTQDEFYVQAFIAMLLPAMVWLMCCVRAWQFHGLLREAEEEAAERIRSEITDLEEGGDQELTIQNESAQIT